MELCQTNLQIRTLAIEDTRIYCYQAYYLENTLKFSFMIHGEGQQVIQKIVQIIHSFALMS